MKRDLNLIRKMLLRIEELDSTKHKITISSFLDLCDNPAIISLHIELLADSYYIEISEPIYVKNIKDFLIYRLTSDGYDYLDSIREASIGIISSIISFFNSLSFIIHHLKISF